MLSVPLTGGKKEFQVQPFETKETLDPMLLVSYQHKSNSGGDSSEISDVEEEENRTLSEKTLKKLQCHQ